MIRTLPTAHAQSPRFRPARRSALLALAGGLLLGSGVFAGGAPALLRPQGKARLGISRC